MSTTRIQLALNVDNVAEATQFYERLFGVPAHKQREGYANFVIADPPLKLVLIEKPGAGGGLNGAVQSVVPAAGAAVRSLS
jgi:catechol 2,3-dioxygenase-like lactoylglutathione lyase family enzyme